MVSKNVIIPPIIDELIEGVTVKYFDGNYSSFLRTAAVMLLERILIKEQNGGHEQ